MPQPWSPTAATGQFDGIAAGNRPSRVSDEAMVLDRVVTPERGSFARWFRDGRSSRRDGSGEEIVTALAPNPALGQEQSGPV